MERIKEIERLANNVYEDSDKVDAFITGAMWADNNPLKIWHDAEEEPQGDRWNILCEDVDGNCWLANNTSVLLDHGGWEEYVGCELVVSWVYIVDVIALKYRGIELMEGGEK